MKDPGNVIFACENCLHWVARFDHGGPPEGECRRHAPRPVSKPGRDTVRAAWPRTDPEAWCGEFAPDPVCLVEVEQEPST